jgi:hypothetical protein
MNMQRRDSDRDKIDLQVKKALDSYNPAYKEELWNNIAQQLPEKKKPLAAYWASIAALLLLTAGTIGYYATHQNTDLNNTQTALHSSNNSSTINKEKSAKTLQEEITVENTSTNPVANTYKGIEKNALSADVSRNISSNKTGRKTHHFSNKTLHHSAKDNSAQNDKNQIQTPNENAIYASSQKYLERVNVAINPVDNNSEIVSFAGRYQATNNNTSKDKNRNIGRNESGKLTTYAFWKNPAYTGEQGKLNLSFDDKISYLKGEEYSACQDNFGAEYSLPKSRFSVGVYHQRLLKYFSLKTTSGLSTSARLFNLGNGYFKAGAGITYLSSKLFKNNLNYNDQIDPRAGFVYTTREHDFTSVQNTIGADAGMWYNSPHLMAGVSAKNINQPLFGRLEEGARLRREWQLAAAYTIPVKDFSIMPFAEIKTNALNRQAGTMLLVSYKNVVTVGAAYQNVPLQTIRGDIMAFASVEIKNRLRIYGMYGKNMEMQRLDLQQHNIETGLRYQLQ